MSYLTPGASPLRARVEARSAVLVTYLAGRRALIFVLLLAAVIGFLVVHGPLSLLIGVPLLAVAGWLSYLSWPHLGRGPRIVRAVVLLVLVLVLVTHAST